MLVRWENLAGRIGVVVFVVSVAVTPRSSPVVVGWMGGEAEEGSAVEGCPAAPGTTSAGPRAVAATPSVFHKQSTCNAMLFTTPTYYS